MYVSLDINHEHNLCHILLNSRRKYLPYSTPPCHQIIRVNLQLFKPLFYVMRYDIFLVLYLILWPTHPSDTVLNTSSRNFYPNTTTLECRNLVLESQVLISTGKSLASIVLSGRAQFELEWPRARHKSLEPRRYFKRTGGKISIYSITFRVAKRYMYSFRLSPHSKQLQMEGTLFKRVVGFLIFYCCCFRYGCKQL